MAIIRANYQARKNGTAAKAMGRAAKYYTYREGGDQAERCWRSVREDTDSVQTGHAMRFDDNPAFLARSRRTAQA